MTYKIGDKVQLNVGGPKMAVSEVRTDDNEQVYSYRCQWFAGKKLDSGYFPADSLVPVPPDEETK